MRTGLVIMTARSPDTRVTAHPADSAGVRRKLPGQTSWPGSCGQGGTMNAFTVGHSADVYPPAPATMAAAPGRPLRQLTPALMGVG